MAGVISFGLMVTDTWPGTVTAKEGGNYTFTEAEVQFAIKESGAVLTKDPAAKNLTYTGQPQDLVDVGTASVTESSVCKSLPDSVTVTVTPLGVISP